MEKPKSTKVDRAVHVRVLTQPSYPTRLQGKLSRGSTFLLKDAGAVPPFFMVVWLLGTSLEYCVWFAHATCCWNAFYSHVDIDRFKIDAIVFLSVLRHV